MSYVSTKLTPLEQSKVPTPGYVPLLWDELELALSLPSGQRPRIYGHLEGEPWGQIVTLRSTWHLEQYSDLLSFAWLSNTTLADLVSRAK